MKAVIQPTTQVRTHQVRIKVEHSSWDAQVDCAEDEQPHQWYYESFFMLESEVTQQQYIELMNANPSQNYQCGKSVQLIV